MIHKSGIIGPEDYAEPQCVLCGNTGDRESIKPIPQQRVVEKLDGYTSRNDYEGARKHLDFWMNEAIFGNDQRGELLLSNEYMGLYRKMGNEDKAIEYATNALHLLKILECEDNITAATTYINAATVYDAFDQPETAVGLFEKALPIYEKHLEESDPRFGGLFNNMGLAKAALKRFGEADELYQKALRVMSSAPHGQLEQAITYLNMANAVEDEYGLEVGEQKINSYLDLAEKLLDDESLEHDGYYAFVCEKCAPTFEYYGYFLTAEKLKKESKEIYERS